MPGITEKSSELFTQIFFYLEGVVSSDSLDNTDVDLAR
jgi:hypothetical protein